VSTEGVIERKNGYAITRGSIADTTSVVLMRMVHYVETDDIESCWRLRSRRNQHARVEPDVMGTRPERAGPRRARTGPYREAAAAAAG